MTKPTKSKFTVKEVCELVPINVSSLRHLTVGRTQISATGKKWHTPPILKKGMDYKMAIENNRTKFYYYPSSIKKLKAHKES